MRAVPLIRQDEDIGVARQRLPGLQCAGELVDERGDDLGTRIGEVRPQLLPAIRLQEAHAGAAEGVVDLIVQVHAVRDEDNTRLLVAELAEDGVGQHYHRE